MHQWQASNGSAKEDKTGSGPERKAEPKAMKPVRKRSLADAKATDQPSDDTACDGMKLCLPEERIKCNITLEQFEGMSKRLKADGLAQRILQYMQSGCTRHLQCPPQCEGQQLV